MVRCGFCRAVFNAYDTLLPEFGTAPSDVPEAEQDFPAPLPAQPMDETSAYQVEPQAQAQAHAHTPQTIDEAAPLANWESKIDPDLDWQVDDVVEFSATAKDAVRPDQQSRNENNADDGTVSSPFSATAAPVTTSPQTSGTNTSVDDINAILLSDLPTRAQIEPDKASSHGLLYGLLSLLLAPLLIAQAVYFLRGPITLSLPETRPMLERICQQIGCTIPLARQLELLRIESSALETDPEQPNHAKLRVSFSNRSNTPQAWPHFLLKLTDPRGDSLAQRAIKPTDYLTGNQSVKAGMPALSEREYVLDLDLGGLSAAGYEVKPHYP